jgi:hypothetical protein
VETEEHFLLQCAGLQIERALLQMKYSWLFKQVHEDQTAWIERIISKADIAELAKVILHLKNQRAKKISKLLNKNITISLL